MTIDIHTHMGRTRFGSRKIGAPELLRFMDKNRIEKAVVLPNESPEDLDYYFTTEEVLKTARRHPDRIIPFCNVDPRHNSNDGTWDPEPVIREYVEAGCKGLGEVLACMPVNDKRMKNIYRACGNLGIPVLPEFRNGGKIALQDKVGTPYFEEVLREFPKTVFIAHGPGFWAEISDRVTDKDKYGYPAGRIGKPGKVDYLLAKYPNLYGDLSARSAYNALSRDPEFAKSFLGRYSRRLLFGTDYFIYGMETPIVEFLKDLGLDKETYRFITRDNAATLLNV